MNNQLSYDSIDQIEAAWTSTPEVRPGTVSNGDHVFRIDTYRPDIGKTSGNPMIFSELTAVGGDDDGTTLPRYNTLKDAQAVGRYKAELKDIGINVDSPEFSLKAFIDSGWMIGKHVVANAFTKKDEQGRDDCKLRLIRFANEADMAGVTVPATVPAPAAPPVAVPQPVPAAAAPAGVPAAPAAGNPWAA